MTYAGVSFLQSCRLRSIHLEVFRKKGVLIKFPKFTGYHLCQSFFFSKTADLRLRTLLESYWSTDKWDLKQTRREGVCNKILCILRHKILVCLLKWADSYRKSVDLFWRTAFKENFVVMKTCSIALWEWRIKWRKLKSISNISSKFKIRLS